MWIAIFSAVIICTALSIVFLMSRIKKFSIVKKISNGRKVLSQLIPLIVLAVLSALLALALGTMNCIICLLHLVAFWGIADLTGFIIQKIRKKAFQKYYTGGISIVITAVWLCFGWYSAHHVSRTEYDLKTDKNVGSLKIVQFADSHMGTTFGVDEFAKHAVDMMNEKPDVILVTGDFVDDNTSRQDMLDACRVLGDMAEESKYGVFFAFGNHDSGYYTAEKRGWDSQELKGALEENDVTVLEDENVLIDDRFYIIGRCDVTPESSYDPRAEMSELTEKLDKNKYMIVMDHQPHDYDAQAESGVDLVLSGHTHGGQLIPITYAGEWMGVNCRTYGHEKRNNTDFIVTSGISDWAMGFKTGCKSEYVVVNVNA